MKKLLAVITLASILLPLSANALFFPAQATGGGNQIDYYSYNLAPCEPSTALTVMLWFMATSTNSSAINTFVDGGAMGNNPSGSDPYFIIARPTTPVQGFRFGLQTQGGAVSSNTNQNKWYVGKWIQYTATWDSLNAATSTAGALIQYVNGVPDVAVKYRTTPLVLASTSSGVIGATKSTVSPFNGTQGMGGELAELRIYNRALTPDEVKLYYATGFASSVGLCHYFPLWTNGVDLGPAMSYATTTSTALVVKKSPPVKAYRRGR